MIIREKLKFVKEKFGNFLFVKIFMDTLRGAHKRPFLFDIN